jgi:hypothetical protein
MKRLRAEILEEAQQPKPVPDSVREFLDKYRPERIDDATWSVVGPIVRSVISSSGYTGEESVKKHSGALAAYLAWRHQERLAVEVEHALVHEAIDAYFMRGLGDTSARVRRDYRSRLHNLASRTNPGLTAPSVTTDGYLSIRPGYTSVEETAIRRVTLRQRRPQTRRQLCAVVGLCGGAGVDPRDLVHMDRSHIDDRGASGGVWVSIPGPRARTVVVRRDYEDLVRMAIDGLGEHAPLVGCTLGKSGSVANAVDNADTYDDCPPIDARRLRTTWITWLATNRVPLNVILHAAGLTSARTLTDIIAALPPVEPGDSLRDGGVR